MRKVLMALVAMLGLTFNMSAQNSGEDNGFGLKLHIGIPSSDYGCPESTSTSLYSTKYTTSAAMFGLDLDNRWYVWHNNHFGVAVDAHWLDLSIGAGEYEAKTTYKISSYDLAEKKYTADLISFEAGFLGVGPMFTYYIGHDMAVDGYYKIVPTYLFAITEDPEDEDDSLFYGGFTFTHNVGAAFRWKFLQAGLEYRLGNVEMEEFDSDDDFEYDSKANSLRIFFGFKF